MTQRNAVIYGAGLLGSSVGLALRSLGWRVFGIDPDPGAISAAAERGAIEIPDDDSAVVPELIVLAAPPEGVVEILSNLDTEALVTDVSGVKGPVVSAAAHLPHFVGGHPMAGGESKGARLASSSLFQGAAWILTSDGASSADLDRVSEIVRAVGANPVVMTAEEHDSAVAIVSHLPHVLAALLMHLVGSDGARLAVAGTGFRDLTRIAAGDGVWWAQVLSANKSHLDEAIGALQECLNQWKAATDNDLETMLQTARLFRLRLGEHDSQIAVILMDEPGEIARVGHALESSRVDVRDLQLRHGEHGGGGVLTISVKPDGRQILIDALHDQGFETQSDV